MRNLLSFVLGVLSRLLYVCLRLILLLDRAVCVVRDLPVRRHIAALLRAAGRRRAVCAAVVFVPLFVLPGLLLTRSGMLILADGQPLGVVSDSAVLLDAANEIERSASDLSGADYYLPMALAAKPVRTAAPLLSQSELEQNLIAASGELDTLAVISVDGKRAAIAAGTADAQQPQVQTPVVIPRARIIFVMIIVAVICGGNGMGIVAAGIYWKLTGNLSAAIAIVVGVTVGALVLAAVIALIYKRRIQKRIREEMEKEGKK